MSLKLEIIVLYQNWPKSRMEIALLPLNELQ